MNNEEEKINIEAPAPENTETVNNTPPKEVVSIVDEAPNMAEQKTELVTDPVTLKTETRVVEEKEVEPIEIKKSEPQEDGPKWKRVLVLIFFIAVFAFVMGMPYINDALDKLKKDAGMSDIERRAKQIEEEQKQREKEKNKPVVQEELKTLTCVTQPQTTADYTKVIEESFEYNSENEIIKSSIRTIYTFTAVNDSYNTLKTQCDANGLKYVDKDGYAFACGYGDTEINIQSLFELETFKPIQDGANTIKANAEYKAKLNTVKKALVAQGYTCE